MKKRNKTKYDKKRQYKESEYDASKGASILKIDSDLDIGGSDLADLAGNDDFRDGRCRLIMCGGRGIILPVYIHPNTQKNIDAFIAGRPFIDKGIMLFSEARAMQKACHLK